jgi:hypothetical protein
MKVEKINVIDHPLRPTSYQKLGLLLTNQPLKNTKDFFLIRILKIICFRKASFITKLKIKIFCSTHRNATIINRSTSNVLSVVPVFVKDKSQIQNKTTKHYVK